MTWLSWRQQRTESLLTVALLALLAALFVPAALHLSSAYAHDHVGACLDRRTQACSEAIGSFGAQAGALRSALGWFNLLPGLIGVALAAPLVLDLESGTVAFAWTQSVTRARWLGTRLGLAVATALAAGGAYSLLLGWYRAPLDRVFGRFSDGAFDVQGTVPVAYVLFALGAGLAVGVVWRRTAPAMVVSFLAYFAGRAFVDMWLRGRLLTPVSATWGPNAHGPALRRAWVLSEGPSDRAGHPFSGSFKVLQECTRTVGGRFKSLDPACMARHGAGYTHAVYQPASRFWEFQGIETALFGGVALLLVAFAAWRVLSSD